jgi:hypothetical protein
MMRIQAQTGIDELEGDRGEEYPAAEGGDNRRPAGTQPQHRRRNGTRNNAGGDDDAPADQRPEVAHRSQGQTWSGADAVCSRGDVIRPCCSS